MSRITMSSIRRPEERRDLAIDVVDLDVAGAGIRLRLLDRQRVHRAAAGIADEQHAVRPEGQRARRSHAGAPSTKPAGNRHAASAGRRPPRSATRRRRRELSAVHRGHGI